MNSRPTRRRGSGLAGLVRAIIWIAVILGAGGVIKNAIFGGVTGGKMFGKTTPEKHGRP